MKRTFTFLAILLTLSCFAQKKMTVSATAYTSSRKENGGYTTTATGKKLTSVVGKCIAVDPRVIPLFSKVYIPGYGMFTALDTGGAIKGRRIDVLLASRSQTSRFGRRKIQVTVYPPANATTKRNSNRSQSSTNRKSSKG